MFLRVNVSGSHKPNPYIRKQMANHSLRSSLLEKSNLSKPVWGNKTFHGTVRNPVKTYDVNDLDKKTRSRLKEREKMSKLFTKSRRTEAKKQFKSRVEMNLQKQKLRKKKLEKKYYDYDFKPKTNKRRIDIYSRAMPLKVVKELEKKKELRLKKKIRQQQETAFGTKINSPFQPPQSENSSKKSSVHNMKFIHFVPEEELGLRKNIFDEDEVIPIEYLDMTKKSQEDYDDLPGFPKF
jgi:hypothetical protein